METADAAQLLLAGPRGRELCLAASGADTFQVISGTYLAQKRPDLRPASGELVWLSGPLLTSGTATALAQAVTAQPTPGDGDLDPDTLLDLLADVVGGATHWQSPDDDETVSADPAVVEALAPFATALAEAPGTDWWDRPVVTGDQHFVSWIQGPRGNRATPPPMTGNARRLARWRKAARQTGTVWWSTPNQWDVVSTSPSLGALPALQLALVEDSTGMDRARVARLQPPPEPRVFEITDPATWVALVETYPLDVSASRTQEWRDLTGRRGRWLIPDWSKVAVDYDGVHLTVLAYLATAGRALPVQDGASVLAGWEPDVTFWLTDCLTQVGEPATWTAVDPIQSSTAWRRQ